MAMNQKHICASAVLCSSQPIRTSTVLWLGMVLKSSVHEHGICQNLFGRLGWLKGIHNASHSGTLSSGLLYTYRHTQVWNQQCSCNTCTFLVHTKEPLPPTCIYTTTCITVWYNVCVSICVQCFQLRLATRGNHIFTLIILAKIVMSFVLTFMHVAQQSQPKSSHKFLDGTFPILPHT